MDGSAVGSTHDSFGFSVAVPVIRHDVLFIVLEVAHVRTAVDPPESCAVLLQGFEDGVFAFVAIAWIAGRFFAEIVKLHEDVELAVAVEVSAACVIGHQGTLDAFVGELYFLVARSPYADRLACALLFSAHYGCHGICAGCCARRVTEVGYGQRCLCYFHSVTIDIVRDVIVFLAEDAPTEIDASARLHSHESTVESVCLSLRESGGSGSCQKQYG